MEKNSNIDLTTRFIEDYVRKAGAKGCIVGISGGVDSAVTTYLACNALGRENVFGLVLPYKTTDPKSLEDADLIIRKLGINHQIIDISLQLDAYFQGGEKKAGYLRVGNKAARERMAVLYDLAQKMSYLVLGTSNKTEWLLGYFTIWGDMAAAIEPIGDLYKTQVWKLAEELDIPGRIISKTPSADLWPGQSDEEEMGLSYPVIDRILYLYIENNRTPEDIIKEGFDEEEVKKVLKMVHQTGFKRRLPSVLQIQYCQEPLV